MEDRIADGVKRAGPRQRRASFDFTPCFALRTGYAGQAISGAKFGTNRQGG